MATARDRSDLAPAQPQSMREIETKFDIPGDFTVPDLARFAGSDGRVEIDTVQLASTYWDTSTLQLLRFRLTLRRREALGRTSDVGWQLKVPGAGFRTELHWPLDESDEPPPALLQLLAPFLVGRALKPAIRLDVTRTRHRLLTADGELVAELAQDDVHAVALGATVRAERWHEVEVELGSAGDRALLAKVGRRIVKAGAVPSTSRSKLARAANGIGNESIGGSHASAGAVLSDYVAVQVDAIVAGHFAIHSDADDSVHQTRVACRRLRSTLRTFSACYDPVAAGSLDEELTWYAGVLGGVRDLEVLRARLAQLVASLPSDLVVGPVVQRIDERLAAQWATARAELSKATETVRYARLLARLVDWRDNPPFTTAAGRPAAALAQAVRKADRTLHRRLDVATDVDGTDSQMHAARKAGKRARYAAEVRPQGRSADLARAKKLQDLLGEFQDSVVAMEAIRQLADQARTADEDTFTYGVLLAEQRQSADAARRKARKKA